MFTKYDWLLIGSFVAFWMSPLFFEPNTNLRWAVEELRVLLTGFYVMYLLCRLVFGRQRREAKEPLIEADAS